MNKNMSNDCSNHNFRSISTNITMHYVFSINNLKEKKIEENDYFCRSWWESSSFGVNSKILYRIVLCIMKCR
jgi:hypothetical protein